MIRSPCLWLLAAALVLAGGLAACGSESQSSGTTAKGGQANGGQDVPGDCRIVGRMDVGLLSLCFEPNAGDHGRFVLASGASKRELAVSAPGPTPTASDAGKVGHWRWAALAPDRRTILAQWSAECEVPIAFLVDARGGTPMPVTGEDDWAKSPDSVALGWTTDGRAIVFLSRGLGCGRTAEPPGMYLYSGPGVGELLVRGKRPPIEPSTKPRREAELRQSGS